MEILITGGAGFIGANLVWQLQDRGFRAMAYDNLCVGKADYLPDSSILTKGDIRDRASLTDAMRGIDIVIHLAALGSVVDSVSDPQPNFENNVHGTFSALEAAREAGVKRFIFASTGGALIGEAEPPVDEQSLPKPISPYGASKLCAEAYCHAYAKSFDMETVALRFANIYGPYSGHKKGAVTKFMKCIMCNEPIPIFGDGKASRDYLHVDDLCNGIIQTAEAEVEPGEVFHLASGTETSVFSLAKMVADIAGVPDHPIEFYPPRRGEVGRNFATYDKAKKGLAFEPRLSLQQGLENTWQWFLENKEKVLALNETDA